MQSAVWSSVFVALSRGAGGGASVLPVRPLLRCQLCYSMMAIKRVINAFLMPMHMHVP